jgi:flagellar protein FlbD
LIRLNRINKTSLAVNADLIKFVEAAPDTVITLSTGEKVVVAESVDQIIDLIIEFRRLILNGMLCPAAGLCSSPGSPVRQAHHKLERRCESVPAL